MIYVAAPAQLSLLRGFPEWTTSFGGTVRPRSNDDRAMIAPLVRLDGSSERPYDVYVHV